MTQKKVKPKNLTKGKVYQLKGQAGLDAKVAAVEEENTKPELPPFKAGDTIRVHVRIREGEKERIQAFDGVVIQKSNHGKNRSFTVRKISQGIGVERVFLETSPKLAKVQVLQVGKVRQSKIYHLRKLQGRKARIERDVKEEESLRKSNQLSS